VIGFYLALRYVSTIGTEGDFRIKESFISKVIYIPHASQNISQTYKYSDLGAGTKSLVLACAFLRGILAIIYYCLAIFNVISAVAAHEITKKTHDIFFSDNLPGMQILLVHYENMCDHIKRLNQINNRVFWLCSWT